MSCQIETTAATTRFFKSQLLLCSGCHRLAESADREIAQALHRAKASADTFLVEHILKGGLLRGGAGPGAENIRVEVTHAESSE